MHVNTTRFGTVSVEDDRVIDLPAGLLGFSGHEQWVLLQPDDDGIFFWLQSVDRMAQGVPTHRGPPVPMRRVSQ